MMWKPEAELVPASVGLVWTSPVLGSGSHWDSLYLLSSKVCGLKGLDVGKPKPWCCGEKHSIIGLAQFVEQCTVSIGTQWDWETYVDL